MAKVTATTTRETAALADTATTTPETAAPADTATTTPETAVPADATTAIPETATPADTGATETASTGGSSASAVEVFRGRITGVVGRTSALIEQLDTSPLSAGVDTIRELAELVSELAAAIETATAKES